MLLQLLGWSSSYSNTLSVNDPVSPCAETPASHHYSPACTCRQIPQQLSVGSESGPWQHPPAHTTHHQCWRTGTQPHWGQEDTPGDQCDHNTNKRCTQGLDSLTAQLVLSQIEIQEPNLPALTFSEVIFPPCRNFYLRFLYSSTLPIKKKK